MGTTLFWLVFALFAVTVTAAQQDDPDAKCVNAQDGSPPPLTWDWPMVSMQAVPVARASHGLTPRTVEMDGQQVVSGTEPAGLGRPVLPRA